LALTHHAPPFKCRSELVVRALDHRVIDRWKYTTSLE
jgi:hypothetical protein